MSEHINTMTNIASSSAEQKGKFRQERIIDFKKKIKEIEKELKNQDLTEIHREMLEEGKRDLVEYIRILENFNKESIT